MESTQTFHRPFRVYVSFIETKYVDVFALDEEHAISRTKKLPESFYTRDDVPYFQNQYVRFLTDDDIPNPLSDDVLKRYEENS